MNGITFHPSKYVYPVGHCGTGPQQAKYEKRCWNKNNLFEVFKAAKPRVSKTTKKRSPVFGFEIFNLRQLSAENPEKWPFGEGTAFFSHLNVGSLLSL